MTIKPIHIVVLVLLILSVILAYEVVISSLNPYVTVSQVAGNSDYLQQEIQILATVANFSVDDQGAFLVYLTDGNSTITVHYTGVPPQGLKTGQQVVAIGMLTAPGQMNATQILVKCPSKYE
jgi:cytochrome c-type biogenesis protein CcmE